MNSNESFVYCTGFACLVLIALFYFFAEIETHKALAECTKARPIWECERR